MTVGGVAADLHRSCYIEENSTGPKPADPQDVEFIVERLSYGARPALDAANTALSRLQAAQKKAFAGDPNASQAAGDVAALRDVIAAYGRSVMLIEDDGDLYASCKTYPAYQAAEDSLLGHEIEFVNISLRYQPLYTRIQDAFTATLGTCKTVRVREEIPAKDIQKAGPAKTSRSGGATLVYPKSLDVGKKPKKLPVNVKSPAADYGSISVTRGSKGIVATGGGFTDQAFGLLMTIPAKTKPGKVTITFRTDSGVVVTGTMTLV